MKKNRFSKIAAKMKVCFSLSLPILLLIGPLALAVDALTIAPASALAKGFSSDAKIATTFLDAASVQITATGTFDDGSGQKVSLSAMNGVYYDHNFQGYYFQGGDKKTGVQSDCQSHFRLFPQNGNFYDKDPTAIVQTNTIVLPTKSDLYGSFSISLPPTGTTGTKCMLSNDYQAKIADPQSLENTTYIQTDANTLLRADQDPQLDNELPTERAFNLTQLTDGSSIFLNTGSGDACPDLISSPDPNGKATLTDQKNNPDPNKPGNCLVNKTYTVYVLSAAKYQNLVKAISNSTGSDSAGASGDIGSGANLSLQCNAGFNPLNWLLCGAVKGMVNIIGILDHTINSELSIGSTGTTDDPSQIFGSSSDTGQYNVSSTNTGGSLSSQNSFYTAWKSIRNLALGLMVVAGLVIIIAQAFGTELVDAYTFRKMLPRLIISALAITLSWQLLQFFVKLTNDLGYGVRFLIYQPFSGLQNVINGGLGGNAATNFFAVGALASLGIFGLLSFAATAALAVFVAFLLLVIRQIVVIVLIIVAPIALVAYILPNTQNLYKLWWESLSKALLIFPIISAFIAAGRVFSLVAIQGTGGNPPTAINQFVGFAAYFAPYLLLPAAFKLAGGTLGRLSGMVNDKGKGGFDRLKNFRKSTTAKRMQALKSGSLYQDRGLGKVANNIGRRAAVGTRGRFGVGATGRAALGIATMANNEEALKNNSMLRELKNYDDGNNLLALSGGSESGARAAARDLFTDADGNYDENRANNALAAARAVGFTRQNAAAAFQTSSQNKWRAVGAGRYDTLQNGINRLAGGNEQEAQNMAYNAQYFNRESGRSDLGGNWLSEDMQSRASQLALRNYGNNDISTAAGKENVRRSMSDLVALDGMGRTGVSAMANGFTAQTKQNASTLQRMIKYGNDDERQIAATRMLELQKALPYASGDNQAVINKMLSDSGIDYEAPEGVDTQLAAIALQTTTADPQARVYANGLSRGARSYDQDPQAHGGSAPP